MFYHNLQCNIQIAESYSKDYWSTHGGRPDPQSKREFMYIAPENFFNPLISAIEKNRVDVVKSFINSEITSGHAQLFNANLLMWDEMTPIMIAAASEKGENDDSLEMMQMLVQHNANINVMQQDVTPLMLAALNGRVRILKFLLKQPGIKVMTINGYGSTALSYAAQNNHLECVNTLIEFGAADDPESCKKAIEKATENNAKQEIIQALQEACK